jgi:hypothetical protein
MERGFPLARANPGKVEEFGDQDLLQMLIWRESFRFHFAAMRAGSSLPDAAEAPQ